MDRYSFLLPTSSQFKRTSERSRLFAFVKYIRTFAAVMKKRNSTLYGQASLRAFIHPGPNASYRPKAMRGKVQIVRHPRGSRAGLCRFTLRLHQAQYIRRQHAIQAVSNADAPYPAAVLENSLAVDAACSGNPGAMEYRGVHVASRQQVSTTVPCTAPTTSESFLPSCTALPC